MRVVVFYLYLCFYVIGGGNFLHAATPHNHPYKSFTRHLSKSGQNTDQGNIFIEDDDLDLEEEYFNGDDCKDDFSARLFSHYHNLHYKHFLAVANNLSLNYYSQHFGSFQPNLGFSNPIYLTQRVLRL